ncbi:hypothetical protein A4G18_07800 [Pasteurellaceae bacterium Pebbles2]|nr:hypothetical protein [Pasteurellaceae bacterium Pebbles2]
MINFSLILCISAFFLYSFYEQFALDRRKGQTRLKVRLKKRTKLDSLIFVALIIVLIWQSLAQIPPTTLYLLFFLIILSLYLAFFRTSQLILKPTGFYLGTIFIHFDKIQQVNLAPENKFVFELKNGKRIIAQLENKQDVEQVVNFFGGYKNAQ